MAWRGMAWRGMARVRRTQRGAKNCTSLLRAFAFHVYHFIGRCDEGVYVYLFCAVDERRGVYGAEEEVEVHGGFGLGRRDDAVEWGFYREGEIWMKSEEDEDTLGTCELCVLCYALW